MTELLLKSLDIDNFRSIRGHVHAPLDAKVVLLHGENGAGKTSLLSAIELALTGKVQSLERADPGYQKQLLHRSASKGSLALKTFDGTTNFDYSAELTSTGASPVKTLEEARASFFRERVFLPQSLLGQLLQIYQDAGSDAGSPLAQFVGKLLGLDRLDALEAGLKPLADVRNVRKNVEGWQEGENEKARLDRLLSDQRKARDLQTARLDQELAALKEICAALDLTVAVEADQLDDISEKLDAAADLNAFQSLSDQQRRLSSIKREIEVARGSGAPEAAAGGGAAEQASRDYLSWEAEHGDRVANLRLRAQDLLSGITLPSEPAEFLTAAVAGLETERKQLDDRVTRARADIERHAAAQDERDVAVRQRDTIDQEISKLSSRAGSLASLLAELSSFITDSICPVCERDYSETGPELLSDHVHDRVRTLTASAERILTLGRTRGEAQVTIERLDRELDSISPRLLGEEALANLDRRLAQIVSVAQDLLGAENVVREGGRLRAADVALRRVVAESQSRNVALTAARETLNDFAAAIGAPTLTDGESFEEAASRFDGLLTTGASRLEQRLSMRRRGADHIDVARSAIQRRKDIDGQIAQDLSAWERADQALEKAQALREQGNGIRNAVDAVRSDIIRREFNDRLNRLWRDLFVRLAPGEPFVPAFRIPESSTQRLQPKLITEHRDGGDAGGTPGAMLSAGNLNTAALTLFTALHLSVPKELPWLILDDPVQSMDDVHIAHFAALLRTLSKEHGRQIMIAVHDRQLFEYLRLELSPAYSEDSLLTLELSRGPRRDSICVSRRYSYKEETALLTAA